MNPAVPSELVTSMIASLDLSDFEDVASGELVIVHPKTKAPTSSRVLLAGMEHPERKKIDMARTRRVRSEFAASGKMPVTDPLEEYQEQTDYLVSCTMGWNLTFDGQDLAFSSEAARKLYIDPKRQWFRAQVSAGLQKTELFIAASAKT
jgi:hypothetical protein